MNRIIKHHGLISYLDLTILNLILFILWISIRWLNINNQLFGSVVFLMLWFFSSGNLALIFLGKRRIRLLEYITYGLGSAIIIWPVSMWVLNVYLHKLINVNTVEIVMIILVIVNLAISLKSKSWQIIERGSDWLFLLLFTIFFSSVIIISSKSEFLSAADPYAFKSLSDYILNTGNYPIGFQPYFLPTYYWNYEPFYTLLMSVFAIGSKASTFFVYKYLGILISVLTLFPAKLLLEKLVKRPLKVVEVLLFFFIFVSSPIFIREIYISRPQTILFFLVPYCIIGLSRRKMSTFLYSSICVLLLTKFHIFGWIFVPIMATAWIKRYFQRINVFLSVRFNILLLIVVTVPYLVMFLNNNRIIWIKSLIQSSIVQARFNTMFTFSDHIFYLGVIGLVSLGVFIWYCFSVRSKIIKKPLSFLLVTAWVIVLTFLCEITKIIGIDSIRERFFIHLSIMLPICFMYVYFNKKWNIKLVNHIVLGLIFMSFFVTGYEMFKYNDKWILTDEKTSLMSTSSFIDKNSIVITQKNNYPLIRHTLPLVYIADISTHDQNQLFGSGSSYKINNIVNNVIDTRNVEYSKIIIESIKNVWSDNSIDKINESLLLLNRFPLYLKISIDGSMIDRLRVSNILSTLLVRMDEMNQRLVSNGGSSDNLYIIYSKQREKINSSDKLWWKEASISNPDFRYFETQGSCFETVLNDNVLAVWKYRKECIRSVE